MSYLAHEITRLAQLLSKKRDQKLFNLKSKSAIKNYIYKVTEPLTKGIFRDENWSNVMRVFNAINDLGVDFDWWVENGGYSVDGSRKEYMFRITLVNTQQKKFEIDGCLTCAFCGTVDDPKNAYDMVFQLF